MNMQNAIDYFKSYIEFSKEPDMGAPTLEPYGIAVDAMEKQIPKKPNIGNDNGRERKCCANCGCFFLPTSKYCSKCGQAIDWGD